MAFNRQPEPGQNLPTVAFQPKSWKEQNAERLRSSQNIFNIVRDRNAFTVDPDPEFDYLKRAEELTTRTAQIRSQLQAQRDKNRQLALANTPVNISVPNVVGTGNYPKNQFGQFLQAIAGKESGGNYGAVNPDSGAMGKYQIMPANLAGSGRGWDYEALGRDISSQQFLSSPKLQEAIARHKLRQYYTQYGPAGAASAWYSGSPSKWNDRTPQGNYPSIHGYVMDILKALGL